MVANDNGFDLLVASLLKMEDVWRRKKWQKKGGPKGLYPDMSCKDASVHLELPVLMVVLTFVGLGELLFLSVDRWIPGYLPHKQI